MEEALRESEERCRAIIESLEDAYYEVDLAGNLTFFNDPLCKILGYSPDELMGMNNRLYMSTETAKIVYRNFNQVYLTGKPAKALDWEVMQKHGDTRLIEASVSLIRDSGGVPVDFRGIARDITERKKLIREQEVRSEVKERLTRGFYYTQLAQYYSTKRPFDFNAGGKGLELMRLKLLETEGAFRLSFESSRCAYLEASGGRCAGKISSCPYVNSQ